MRILFSVIVSVTLFFSLNLSGETGNGKDRERLNRSDTFLRGQNSIDPDLIAVGAPTLIPLKRHFLGVGLSLDFPLIFNDFDCQKDKLIGFSPSLAYYFEQRNYRLGVNLTFGYTYLRPLTNRQYDRSAVTNWGLMKLLFEGYYVTPTRFASFFIGGGTGLRVIWASTDNLRVDSKGVWATGDFLLRLSLGVEFFKEKPYRLILSAVIDGDFGYQDIEGHNGATLANCSVSGNIQFLF